MYIHNFYSDLLLSVRVVFNNHVFERSDFIKRYEFNIGNRSFQLPQDYKTNFEFPNIMVVLNDEIPAYGQRPDVTMKLNGFNLDQIPVMYNRTTKNFLYVQEEMSVVPITCTINCESQLQAKEVAAVCKRWLPIDKYIQFMEFSSFLEVSPEFLSNIQFNPAIHDIVNIFMKKNYRTGEFDYCFSLTYQPFIKLNSIMASIPDSASRSFQVVVDLNYMIPMPLYLFNDLLPEKTEKINISFDAHYGEAEPIADNMVAKMANQLVETPETLKGYVKRQIIISEDTSEQVLVNVDNVAMTLKQITGSSSGSRNIQVTHSVDEKLCITIGNAIDTVYKVPISNITDDGVNITLNDDEYLLVTLSVDHYDIVLYRKTKTLSVVFNKTDFEITSAYSYNIISEETCETDYTGIVDTDFNSVTFTFLESIFNASFKPSATHPIIVQFYLANTSFPFSFLGIPPAIDKVKVPVIRPTAVGITWTTGSKTTTSVEYGLTTEYGSTMSIDDVYSYAHSLTVCGLTANSTYHFRINSVDENGASCISSDYTFTTTT